MKEVLIINGHPDKESYNYALSRSYKSGLEPSQVNISEINITDLDFNPNLKFGYRQRIELEEDLKSAIEKIKKADHIVWFFPIWWHGSPAIMKGFIDRIFLPGIAFELMPGKPFPKKLLKGKSARLVITADTPKWYQYWIMKKPAIRQLKNGTLKFCGITPVKVSYIAPLISSKKAYRSKWLKKMKELGRGMK